MTIVNLYRYEDSNGITVTPIQRDSTDTPYYYRLVADEGKVVTLDGKDTYPCVDVADTSGWYEIDDTSVVNL